MQNFIARIIPFILIGIALVALIFGMILLAYLFIFGALVGLILFGVAWVRDRFFVSKKKNIAKRDHSGRTIDHQ